MMYFVSHVGMQRWDSHLGHFTAPTSSSSKELETAGFTSSEPDKISVLSTSEIDTHDKRQLYIKQFPARRQQKVTW